MRKFQNKTTLQETQLLKNESFQNQITQSNNEIISEILCELLTR